MDQYHDLLNLLKSDEANRKDVYSELMAKEENVLDTVSRVSNQERIKSIYDKTFGNLSLRELWARFAFTWQNIFHEMVIERMFDQALDVFFAGDRKVYVGMTIILVGLFFFATKI